VEQAVRLKASKQTEKSGLLIGTAKWVKNAKSYRMLNDYPIKLSCLGHAKKATMRLNNTHRRNIAEELNNGIP
jgi:hypothetical protein